MSRNTYRFNRQRVSTTKHAGEAEQNAFNGMHINTEPQYMELEQLEGVYDIVNVAEKKVSFIKIVKNFLEIFQ